MWDSEVAPTLSIKEVLDGDGGAIVFVDRGILQDVLGVD